MSHDLIEPPSSNQPISRAGKVKRWRVALANILTPARAGGVFVAVIRDQGTGARLREVELWASPPDGPSVDLFVEFQKEPKSND